MTSAARRRADRRPAPQRAGAGARVRAVLFWAVELPLAAAVAVGLAAAYLAPGPFWWAQLVAVGLPYATWALVVWTLVPLASRRWGVAAVHLVLVGLVVVRVAPQDRRAPASAEVLAADSVLHVVTFNVPEYGPSREALGDSTVAFVRASAPDVLALQDAWVLLRSAAEEARTGVQVEAVVQALPYRLSRPDRMLPIYTWRRRGTSVPVVVGEAVEVTSHVPVPLVAAGEGRGSSATRVVMEWEGRPLALYNVHLRSFGGDKPWENDRLRRGPLRERLAPDGWMPYLRQYREAYRARGAEVTALAKAIASDSLPVLLVGDLNSTADNWSARRLRTAGTPRTDAYRAVGDGWGRTYHARRPLVRIDVVYADPALEVLAARAPSVGFSDHRPVEVWLRWRD